MRAPLLSVLAAALAGCAGLAPWSQRSGPADGAVLFKLRARSEVKGMSLDHVIIPFFTPGEKKSSHLLFVDGRRLNRFPNDVILVSLPPATYAGISPRFGVTGRRYHVVMLPRPAGAFQDFSVEAGSVTVLGLLDVTIKAAADPDAEQGFTAKGSNLAYDDRPAAKRAVVVEALGRPEADLKGWRQPLESLRKRFDWPDALP